MLVNAEILVREIQGQVGHVTNGRIRRAMPGELHFKFLGRTRRSCGRP